MGTKNIRSNSSTHLSYGIETPELIGVLVGISLFLLVLALLADKVQLRWLVAGILGALFCLCSLLLILLAFWMGWSYFLGKGRSSQLVLTALQLKGKEKLLDLGCGRGLILIEAAKKIKKGKCVGLDNWSQKDFYSNNAEKTLKNAAIEGVAKRVRVVTGDIRQLPFKKGEFDLVTANLALTRLKVRNDLQKVVSEMTRVLKKGGRIVLQDYRSYHHIAEDMKSAGLRNIQISDQKCWTFPPMRIITAQK